MTEAEFRALIKLPLGGKVLVLRYSEERLVQPIKIMEAVHEAACVTCHTGGWSREVALQAAQSVLDAVDGRECFVRVLPEADTFRDFMTSEVLHTGYVRFHFFDRPGKQHGPTPRKPAIYLGLATAEARP